MRGASTSPAARPSGLWIGLTVLAAIGLAGAFASILAPYPPELQDPAGAFSGPSSAHLLGTDDIGRDVLSRLLHAARVSLAASLFAVGVAVTIGVPIGLLAGYVGGAVDSILMRVVDTALSFPALLLAMAIIGALGPNIRNAMLAVGVILAPVLARLARAQTLAVRGETYVEAAKLFGASHPWIVIRHVVPNVSRAIVVQCSLLLGYALIAEASLSFLGLGVQPPDASWGSMLARAQRYIVVHPWMMLPPGIAIVVTVLAFNLVADGINAKGERRA